MWFRPSIAVVCVLVVLAGCTGADTRTEGSPSPGEPTPTTTGSSGETRTWTPTPFDSTTDTPVPPDELKTPSEAIREAEREQLAVVIGDFLHTTTLAEEFPDAEFDTWDQNRTTIAVASFWNETYGTVNRICYNRSIAQPFLVTTVRDPVNLTGYEPFTVEAQFIVKASSPENPTERPIARIVAQGDYFACDVEFEANGE